MDTTILVVIIVAVAVVAMLWWRRRRSSRPPIPAAPGASRGPEQPRRLVAPPAPQVLDRNTVLRGSRAFDPTNWDDTPDGSEEEPGEDGAAEPAAGPPTEDLPRFFDRDYLERKQRGETPTA